MCRKRRDESDTLWSGLSRRGLHMRGLGWTPMDRYRASVICQSRRPAKSACRRCAGGIRHRMRARLESAYDISNNHPPSPAR